MTNSYDNPERQISYPQDLDREAEDVRRYQQTDDQTQYRGSMRASQAIDNMPEAASIRSRLALNLRASVEECNNLGTFYSNLGHTLEACLSQLETKK